MNGAGSVSSRWLLLTLPPQQRTIPRVLARRLANYPDPRTNSSHAPSHYTHLAPRILPLPSQSIACKICNSHPVGVMPQFWAPAD